MFSVAILSLDPPLRFLAAKGVFYLSFYMYKVTGALSVGVSWYYPRRVDVHFEGKSSVSLLTLWRAKRLSGEGRKRIKVYRTSGTASGRFRILSQKCDMKQGIRRAKKVVKLYGPFHWKKLALLLFSCNVMTPAFWVYYFFLYDFFSRRLNMNFKLPASPTKSPYFPLPQPPFFVFKYLTYTDLVLLLSLRNYKLHYPSCPSSVISSVVVLPIPMIVWNSYDNRPTAFPSDHFIGGFLLFTLLYRFELRLQAMVPAVAVDEGSRPPRIVFYFLRWMSIYSYVLILEDLNVFF